MFISSLFSTVSFVNSRYEGNDALFVGVDLTTLDFDFGAEMHPEECLTEVTSLEDVIRLLEKDVEKFPTHVWEIQETRSGVHCVLIDSLLESIPDYEEYLRGFDCDPLYIENTIRKGYFDWRVSPKSDGDPVAKPIKKISGANGWEDPLARLMLDSYYRMVEEAKKLFYSGELYNNEPEWERIPLNSPFHDEYPNNEGYIKWAYNPFTDQWEGSVKVWLEPDWWSIVPYSEDVDDSEDYDDY